MDDTGFRCSEHNIPLDDLWQCPERECQLAHCPQCGEREFAECEHLMASIGEEVYHVGFELLLPRAAAEFCWWTRDQVLDAFAPDGESWVDAFSPEYEQDEPYDRHFLSALLDRRVPPMVSVDRQTWRIGGDAWTLYWLRNEHRTEVLYGILEDYAHVSASLERLAAMPKLGAGPQPLFTPR